MGLVTRVVPDGTLAAAADELAAAIARLPRGGLAASKAIVADIRAGKSGNAAQAYAAALRRDKGAKERIAGFVARKKKGR
jgi:hypothetical protein